MTYVIERMASGIPRDFRDCATLEERKAWLKENLDMLDANRPDVPGNKHELWMLAIARIDDSATELARALHREYFPEKKS